MTGKAEGKQVFNVKVQYPTMTFWIFPIISHHQEQVTSKKMFGTRQSVGQLQGFKNFLISEKAHQSIYIFWSDIHLMMRRS